MCTFILLQFYYYTFLDEFSLMLSNNNVGSEDNGYIVCATCFLIDI